ncbi:MAG TPA: SPOR domain-containing protein [Spirochaetota bacterium]|jgi:preprotein translocase subunit SecF|nr:SPOR domain-containing protein [Spirochaetota bacterium]HOF13123.1 SPOR domain-containing protein [Spirochaetota bacterium]HOM87968.1 SPOR domain-containing protein [Spirochaetota bacterium]HOR93952.1 SPOR domain-containing protein [Spirochaetota bacterium]HPD04524.1 SPOR domain-containing protein [Spirochaetota bacterium]
MQNFDFYQNNKSHYNDFVTQDLQHYTIAQNTIPHTHSQRNAHRMLAAIIALIIISFTAGIVVGIKFATGNTRTIIDPQTKIALSNAAQKAKTIMAPQQKPQFSKIEYPFAIKIGNTFNKNEATQLAALLSKTGQRIIIAKNKEHYHIFAGPYKTIDDAKKSLKIIMGQQENGNFKNAIIIKR